MSLRAAILFALPFLALEADEICTLNGKAVPNINYVRNGEIRCIDSKTKKLIEVMVLKDMSAMFTARYAPNGQFTRLTCHRKEYVPKDYLKICGYEGLVEVTFYDEETGKSRTETYRNGQVENAETRAADRRRAEAAAASHDRVAPPEARTQTSTFPNGKVHKEIQYFGAFYHGSYKEFHESGKLVRHATYDHGSFRGEKTWYLNGRMKSETTVKPSGDRAMVEVKDYHDTGKLKGEATYRADGFALRGSGSWYSLPVGTSRHYDEQGGLVEERTYGEKGRISARKTYDGKGKLLKAEEYYEDGSRK